MRKLQSIIFSRYFFSALIILFEVGILAYLLVEISVYSWIFVLFAFIANIAVVVAVINAEYNPEYRVTWLAIVLFVPGVGALLYILFRRRTMSKKEVKIAKEAIRKIADVTNSIGALADLGESDPHAAGKAMSILDGDKTAEVYKNTDCRYYSWGKDMYSDMLADISRAEEFVFFEYFIISDGEMWQGIYKELLSCVARGVEVRLMFDDIGCMRTLPKSFLLQTRRAGINVSCFSPVSPRVSAVHNNRDHRKICVVDGKVAYTGGINIADEYIGEKIRFGIWKDGGVRIFGDAVAGFTALFLLLFDMNTREYSNYEKYIKPVECKEEFTSNGYFIPFGSGPSPLYERQVGKRAYIDIINQATRYVYITTPYLIIDFDLREALVGAARRGVDVRIITPGIPDKKLVKVMTKSSYPYLVSGGVKIYEYTPGFMHHKVLVSDDIYAIVGTINLDYRSFVHHYEDALWIYRASAVIDAREDFRKTLADCREITKAETKLSLKERIIKWGLRVFAPLL